MDKKTTWVKQTQNPKITAKNAESAEIFWNPCVLGELCGAISSKSEFAYSVTTTGLEQAKARFCGFACHNQPRVKFCADSMAF